MKKLRTLILLSVVGLSTCFITQSCDKKEKEYIISAPPASMHFDSFYKKYSNVNGIHIMSSNKVPDEAFLKACEIIDFMTKGLPDDVINQMRKSNARLAIMARYEGTTDIPEHAYLKDDTTLNWDIRARGLGGDMELPLTTCAEENLLCYQIDKYHAEDITIHEFAHAIHLIGIAPIHPEFNDLLEKTLAKAVAEGKYENTYAKTNYLEYWAEGVQDWFNVNGEVAEADGKHNWVNTREDLKKYDPALYEIISRYFSDFDTSPSCHGASNLYTE